jgi:hypothetical protein
MVPTSAEEGFAAVSNCFEVGSTEGLYMWSDQLSFEGQRIESAWSAASMTS